MTSEVLTSLLYQTCPDMLRNVKNVSNIRQRCLFNNLNDFTPTRMSCSCVLLVCACLYLMEVLCMNLR